MAAQHIGQDPKVTRGQLRHQSGRRVVGTHELIKFALPSELCRAEATLELLHDLHLSLHGPTQVFEVRTLRIDHFF